MDKVLALMGPASDFSTQNFLGFSVSLLASLIYGIGSYYLYRFYFRHNEPLDGSLSRSLPIISVGVTSIFYLIRSSLPLSLGLLGALSFIRFRNPVKRAEDIAFILIVIAGGLACSVNQFGVALSLIIVMLLFAGVRPYVNGFFLGGGQPTMVTIYTQLQIEPVEIESRFLRKGIRAAMSTMTFHHDVNTFVLLLSQLKNQNLGLIKETVRELDPVAKVDVFFPENQTDF